MRRSATLALLVGALALAALTTTGSHAQSPADPQNLLPNGGFEDGLDGWAPPAGATLEVVDQPFESGDAAAKVTASGAPSVTLMTQYWRVPVAPGAEHTLSVWVRSDARADSVGPKVLRMEVSLEFVDTDGTRVGVLSTQRIEAPTAGWQRVEVGPETAPTDATYARLRVTAEVSASGAVFYVDSAELTAGPPPPTPAPTETPGDTPTSPTATEPSVFASLTNGDFELPGATPYGWRAHAADAVVTPAGGSRTVTLTSRGSSTAWLHQSFAVEGGRWYEASGLLRPVSNAALTRIRVAWYASEDASGAQLSTDDSDELGGVGDSSTTVSTGPIRAPDNARSAQLRVMLRPASEAPAVLRADDVRFERTAPPPSTPAVRTPVSVPTPEAMPTFFVALTNGDFELPGDTPYGWRAHAGSALVTSDGDSRSVTLTSRGRSTAWLHQSFAIEGGRWYEAGGRLRAVSNASLARIRVAWYASDDASGAQLSTDDSDELVGDRDSFAFVSTGAIRAPDAARSAELRVMLRPASAAPAVLRADDVSFARTAPPPPDLTSEAPPTQPLRPPEAAPSFFVALTNGDFELPGDTPYGWRAHAGNALVTSEGGSRAALLTSAGAAIAWLHQSCAIEGGRWYEVAGRLQPGPNAGLARIRIAWYASEDASGPQLSVTDSGELEGAGDSFATVSTGAIRAPDEARSAQLRIMLRPATGAPATLVTDDVSFTRTAPPPPATPDTPPEAASPAPEDAPSFFASLTNGDFELPGETPYGWRAHGGDALVTSEGASRAAALTSRSDTTAWLHQSFTVEGGRWYEATGSLRLGDNAALTRIRVAWYASDDASGPQLSVADSDALEGVGDSFAAVSTGAIRAPGEARSAQLRIMLRPAGGAPAVLHADDVAFTTAAPPAPDPTPEVIDATPASPAPEAAARTSPPPVATSGEGAMPALEPYHLRSASAVLLRITELLPDPVQSGSDAEYEWIEVANVGAAALPLAGLILADNHGWIALPTLTLPPGGAIVIAGPRAEIGDAITLRQGSGLFNGLGNSGDRLTLATEDGAIIDALSYGSDGSVDAPPLKAPPAGRSLQRRFDPAGRLIAATVAEQPTPGRLDVPAPSAAVPAPEPGATSAAPADAADADAYTSPSSVESLRKQLDDAASADRTAWIVLASIAAVALVAAAAHRARELLRAAPPAASVAPPRRGRRWRRYASGEQVRGRALSPRRPRRTPPA